ncbi:hypothetical protein [Oceanithermus sp.]|uniref:hypothetical protein n=1 Tax=Oceanithermus sp. TaxID=2268145 RepID=UPI00257C2942|nr:hypothetical protein [Oceanithermus sp.]
MLQKTKYTLFGIFLAALGLWGLAVTIPNSFSSGEVVSAAKMNQNFQALKAAVDTLESKVGALETDNADLKDKLSALQAGMKAVASKTGQFGYALVNADGTLWPDANFDSSGSAVTSSKSATGLYFVTFPGLDLMRGTVMITDADPMSRCTIGFWNQTQVSVECYDVATGNPVDAAFTVLVVK